MTEFDEDDDDNHTDMSLTTDSFLCHLNRLFIILP